MLSVVKTYCFCLLWVPFSFWGEVHLSSSETLMGAINYSAMRTGIWPRPGWSWDVIPFSTGTVLIRGQVFQRRQETFCGTWLVHPRKGSLSSFWITDLKDVCFWQTLASFPLCREGQTENEVRKQRKTVKGWRQGKEPWQHNPRLWIQLCLMSDI